MTLLNRISSYFKLNSYSSAVHSLADPGSYWNRKHGIPYTRVPRFSAVAAALLAPSFTPYHHPSHAQKIDSGRPKLSNPKSAFQEALQNPKEVVRGKKKPSLPEPEPRRVHSFRIQRPLFLSALLFPRLPRAPNPNSPNTIAQQRNHILNFQPTRNVG